MSHSTDKMGHFGDESFQSIHCTGIGNQTPNNREKIRVKKTQRLTLNRTDYN